MEFNPAHIQAIIHKYQQGQCDDSELHTLYTWLNQEGAQEQLEQYLKTSEHAANGDEANAPSETIDAIWGQLIGKIEMPLQEEQAPMQRKSVRMYWRPLQIAASIALAIGLGFALYIYSFDSGDEIAALEKEVRWVTKTAEPGKKLTLTLADGSVVKLNNLATVSFREDFTNDSIRYLKLNGEAFFEVEKSEKPFIVQAGTVTTKVLGTAFNIKTQSDNKVEVALVHGKVQVERNEQTLLLAPNEMAVAGENQMDKRGFDLEKVVGWKDGILHLKGERFEELVEQLEAWYGVEIAVIGKVSDQGFDRSYDNASLKRVLEGLSFIAKFDFQIKENNKVIIHTKN